MSEKPSLKLRGEDAAAAYLERVGICVIDRSWSCSAGTIDVLAWESDTLVLVNVTTRRSCKTSPDGVSEAAKRRVRRIAKAYLEYADLESVSWRLDHIDILVIAEDRALLRHHRGMIETQEPQ